MAKYSEEFTEELKQFLQDSNYNLVPSDKHPEDLTLKLLLPFGINRRAIKVQVGSPLDPRIGKFQHAKVHHFFTPYIYGTSVLFSSSSNNYDTRMQCVKI